MFKAFCYCCKQVIVTQSKEDFTKTGHVDNKDDAQKKYGIATNHLQKDFELCRTT